LTPARKTLPYLWWSVKMEESKYSLVGGGLSAGGSRDGRSESPARIPRCDSGPRSPLVPLGEPCPLGPSTPSSWSHAAPAVCDSPTGEHLRRRSYGEARLSRDDGGFFRWPVLDRALFTKWSASRFSDRGTATKRMERNPCARFQTCTKRGARCLSRTLYSRLSCFTTNSLSSRHSSSVTPRLFASRSACRSARYSAMLFVASPIASPMCTDSFPSR